MCGIVGIITKNKHGFHKVEQTMFYQLLFANLLRGNDATGVITCHNNLDFGTMKEASDSYSFNSSFIDSDLDKDLFKNGSAVIGHNRAKTIGENKDENAHPFVVDGTFAMVHNGTLRNHKKLADTTVDSEALAITFKKAMEQDNFVQAVSEAVWEVEGAFACVWYDQKRHQVGMIRNSQRPLALLETDKSVLFGSELSLLNWIVNRNGEKQVSHTYIKENELYLFDMKEAGGKKEVFPLSLKPAKVIPSAGQNTGYTNGVVPFSGGTSTVVNLLGQGTRCSKNKFKRILKKLINTPICFLLDDWVEKNIERPDENVILLGQCVFADCELSEVAHIIRGTINTKTLGISLKDVENTSDWVGRVIDCVYDNRLSQITVVVDTITPVTEVVELK